MHTIRWDCLKRTIRSTITPLSQNNMEILKRNLKVVMDRRGLTPGKLRKQWTL